MESGSTADDVDTPLVQVHVVDDDALVRKAVTRLVRSAGYEVSAFASAEEFLLHAEAHVRGCVVLDVAMPGLDGLDVQRRLLEVDDVG